MKCLLLLPLPLILLVSTATPAGAGWVDADAAIVNGSFEDNLAGWTKDGWSVAAISQFNGVSPPDGLKMASIASSGHPSRTIENRLGIPTGTLADPDGTQSVGNMLWRMIEGGANEAVTFQWNFLGVPTEQSADGPVDFAFWSLAQVNEGKVVPHSATIEIFARRTPSMLATAHSSQQQTGFNSSLITLPEEGEFLLGFGVVNLDDGASLTHLLIDNVHFFTAAVPEPTTLVLCGIGGVGLAAGAWRRRSA